MSASLELAVEAAKRYGSGPGWTAVVGDALCQGRSMDAPDTVQDGMEWFIDDAEPSISGPVPRIICIRYQGGGAA